MCRRCWRRCVIPTRCSAALSAAIFWTPLLWASFVLWPSRVNREEYEAFVEALVGAEKAVQKDFDKRDVFDGCMPVEIMAQRGTDTLRFGMLKPVGLYDAEGKRPYAVLQLRKENAEGTAYNLVGCQTNLKFPEQKRVFSMIPEIGRAHV